MRKYSLVCIFLCLVKNLQGLKDCSDCITYNLCSRATDLALHNRNSDTQQKFLNSFCGYEGSGYKKIPKVCCSDFEDKVEVNDDIENHPNANLLPDSCGDIDGRRIVGGTTASLYEYPWMALISYKTRLGLQFQCGGSIINSRYVLTAAHCVKNKIIAGVRIGEYDLRYKTDCQGAGDQYACESHIQDMIVEDIIPHENYIKTRETVVNDIALLRLIKPINFTYRNAAPVCLPITASMRKTILAGKKATVVGWGLTENNEDSSVLLKVDVPILSTNQCSSFYNRENVVSELCAGTQNKDSCDGDSGGPLMLESIYKGAYRIIQYGIVSRGPEICGSRIPGIYTDVSKFMGWILDNIRVCCSDFEDKVEVNDDIENHPNANLLPDSCGDIDGRRIVGGTTASLYEYPWMALISYKTRLGLQFQCGGSIINSRYVLTAAHCVKNKIIAGVRIGEYDLRYKTDCQGAGDQYACESHIQDMIVEDIIPHENYIKTRETVVNDIALLRLIKPINFTYRHAAPVCLPITASMRKTILAGKKATVVGWGLTENNEDSSVLLKVDVPILSTNQCSSFYNRENVVSELCAGTQNKDSCDGDSGGPLMLESIYKGAYRIIQYGIVSRGPEICGSRIPGIYTDVSKFMGWILDNIRV